MDRYGLASKINPRKCKVYFQEIDKNWNKISDELLCYTWDVCKIYKDQIDQLYSILFYRLNPDDNNLRYAIVVYLECKEIPNKDDIYMIDTNKRYQVQVLDKITSEPHLSGMELIEEIRI